MDSSKQFGIFIFSIFFIFCIVGCILLIIYTDDTIIKYASSSIICVLALGLFKLTSNLLKCIKDQRKNDNIDDNIDENIAANEIIGSKEIVKIIGGDENNISTYNEKIDKINSEILNIIKEYHNFIPNTSNEAEHKNLFIKNKHHISNKKILSAFEGKFQKDIKKRFIKSRQYTNSSGDTRKNYDKKLENLFAIDDKTSTFLINFIGDEFKSKVDSYKTAVLFLQQQNKDIIKVDQYNKPNLDYKPLVFNNVDVNLNIVNKNYAKILESYYLFKGELERDISDYNDRELGSYDITKIILDKTDKINDVNLKLYELYLTNLKRKEIYAKIAPCESYFNKQIEALSNEVNALKSEQQLDLDKIKKLEESFSAKNDENNENIEDIRIKEKMITDYNNENAKLTAQINTQLQQITTLESTNVELMENIKNNKIKISELTSENNQNKTKITELETVNASNSVKLEENIILILDLQTEIFNLNTKIKELEENQRKLNSEIQDLTSRNASLNSEITELNNKIKEQSEIMEARSKNAEEIYQSRKKEDSEIDALLQKQNEMINRTKTIISNKNKNIKKLEELIKQEGGYKLIEMNKLKINSINEEIKLKENELNVVINNLSKNDSNNEFETLNKKIESLQNQIEEIEKSQQNGDITEFDINKPLKTLNDLTIGEKKMLLEDGRKFDSRMEQYHNTNILVDYDIERIIQWRKKNPKEYTKDYLKEDLEKENQKNKDIIEKEKNKLKRDLELQNKRLSKLQEEEGKQVKQLNTQKINIDNKIEQLNIDKKTLEDNNISLEAEIKNKQKNINELESQIDSQKNEIGELKKELGKINKLNKAYTSDERKITDIENELDRAKKELDSHKETLAELEQLKIEKKLSEAAIFNTRKNDAKFELLNDILKKGIENSEALHDKQIQGYRKESDKKVIQILRLETKIGEYENTIKELELEKTKKLKQDEENKELMERQKENMNASIKVLDTIIDKYKTLNYELKNIDGDLKNTSYYIEQLPIKLSKIENDIGVIVTEKNKEIDNLNTQIVDKDKQIETLNAEINPLKAEITELRKNIESSANAIKSKQTELEDIMKSKAELERLNKELEGNNTKLKSKIEKRDMALRNETDSKNSELNTQIQNLTDENTRLNEKLTAIQLKLDDCGATNLVNNTYISSLASFARKIFSSVFSSKEDESSKIKEFEDNKFINEKFELIFNAHKTFIENKNKEIEELRAKLSTLEKDKLNSNSETDGKLKQLQETIGSLTSQLQSLEIKFKESEKQLGLCKEEIKQKDKEIVDIKKQNEELVKEIERINKESEKILEEKIKPLKDEYKRELKLFKDNKNFAVGKAIEEKDKANEERDGFQKQYQELTKDYAKTIKENSEEIYRLKKEIKGNLDNLEKIKTYLLEVQENTILVDNYTAIKKILETKYDKGKEIDQLIKLHEETTKQLLQNKEILDKNEIEIEANKEAFAKLESEKKEIEQQLQSEIQQLKDNLDKKVISEKAYTVKNKEFEEQILKLTGENKTLSDRIETYIEEIKTKDAEITTLNEKIATNKASSDMNSEDLTSKYKQDLKQIEEEKQKIQKESERLNLELSKELEESKKLLTNGSVTSEANTKKLNLKIEILTKVLTRFEFMNDKLQKDIKELNEKNTELISKYDKLIALLDKSTTESDKIKKELLSIKVAYKLNQNMLRTIKEELNKIKQDLENEINKNKGLTAVNTALVNKISTLEKSIIALTSENTSLKDSLRLLNSKFKNLENKFNSLNKNNSKDKEKYDILLKNLKKLKESKDVIEKNLSLKIDQLEIDKNELERRFKLNNAIKALGSSKLSKQYEDISILYEKQLLEFGKMQARIVQYDIDIKKYIRELDSCRTDLASCETKLNECNANNINKELISENQRLKEEINILKSKSTSNNEFIGDEIIILDSSLLLSKNTKQNEKSKIIVDNDKYSKFIKKNKRM